MDGGVAPSGDVLRQALRILNETEAVVLESRHRNRNRVYYAQRSVSLELHSSNRAYQRLNSGIQSETGIWTTTYNRKT